MSLVHVLNGQFLFLFTVEFNNSLYVLDTNPLSDMWFVNIFYHVVIIHLLNDISSEAQVFNFYDIRFIKFMNFQNFNSGVSSKNSQSNIQRFFFPTFFPESFIRLHFTFKSVMHFECIKKKKRSEAQVAVFLFLPIDVQLLLYQKNYWDIFERIVYSLK